MNGKSSNAEPAAVIIFGASGDLTQRKLVPALHSMACDDLLHADIQVIGVARSSMTDLDFHDRLYEGVAEYARLEPRVCELWNDFAQKVSYLAGSYDDSDTYRRLGEQLARLDAEAGTRATGFFTWLRRPRSIQW